jgi:steroid delta-isomerase-like uncharacterized protein
MSEQNKAVARAVYDVFNGADPVELDDVVAAHAVDHDPYNPFREEGREGLKKVIEMYRSAFPDLQIAVEDQIAEGDKVVTRWVARGTHQGEMMGAPATGKSSEVGGVGIDRIENGQVVEAWGFWDALGMFQQLGLTGEPAGAAQA